VVYRARLLERVQHVELVLEPSLRGRPTRPRISSSVGNTCMAISRLTRGRFGDSHDELQYVIRKPQDRFARVV